jgi:hypothetical protein
VWSDSNQGSSSATTELRLPPTRSRERTLVQDSVSGGKRSEYLEGHLVVAGFIVAPELLKLLVRRPVDL